MVTTSKLVTDPSVKAILDAAYASISSVTTMPHTTKTSSYTLVLADAGTLVETNSASATTITVPPNSSVAFPIDTVIAFSQYGSGQLTIAQGAGVTIRTASSLTARTQYSEISIRKRATDEWIISGDMT